MPFQAASRPFLERVQLGGPCVLCRQWSRTRLCDACLNLSVGTHPRCLRCAMPLAKPSTAECCPACLREAPPLSRCVAALDYAPPWDGLFQRFKFHQSPELASALAPLLAHAVQHALHPTPGPSVDVLLSVPLSSRGLATRGYNQSHELARRLANLLALAYEPQALLRIREPSQQARLNKSARSTNVRGSFVLEPHARPLVKDRRVAVVDDVMTTGATVHELARVLRQAGALDVQAWVLMRA